jgi:hypothetical protein
MKTPSPILIMATGARTNQMKVYVVFQDQETIKGVTSTKERAERAVEKIREDPFGYNPFWLEYELDQDS